MSDVKTSAESAASALAGTELIRGVQGGANVYILASQLATLAGASGSSIVPNAQTGTSYTVLTGDRSKVVTISNAASVAVTLPAAGASFPSGWFVFVANRGAGAVTVTPTTSTIDGSATLVIAAGQGVLIASDGTNYFTSRGLGGYLEVPQNSKSAAYTTIRSDSGKHIFHPSADANARTFTIDSNANVPYPLGTAITFVNETSQVVSIAITTDTLTLAGSTTSGTRSLAQNGVATALKVTTTKWIVSGTGLT